MFGGSFSVLASLPRSLCLHRLDTVMSHQSGVPKDERQRGLMLFLLQGKSCAAKRWT